MSRLAKHAEFVGLWISQHIPADLVVTFTDQPGPRRKQIIGLAPDIPVHAILHGLGLRNPLETIAHGIPGA